MKSILYTLTCLLVCLLSSSCSNSYPDIPRKTNTVHISQGQSLAEVTKILGMPVQKYSTGSGFEICRYKVNTSSFSTMSWESYFVGFRNGRVHAYGPHRIEVERTQRNDSRYYNRAIR